MLHKTRRWVAELVPSAEELAAKLTAHTWCGCTGFRIAGSGYLFLNDATSADGAQEWAVVKGLPEKPPWLQVESITFSWCSYERALYFIRAALTGEYDRADYAHEVGLRLESRDQHGRCQHCA